MILSPAASQPKRVCGHAHMADSTMLAKDIAFGVD